MHCPKSMSRTARKHLGPVAQGWGDCQQEFIRPAKVNSQLTTNSLANNAANNSKEAQKEQTTKKSWTHWIW